jgi:ribose transport system substrate-binding protein
MAAKGKISLPGWPPRRRGCALTTLAAYVAVASLVAAACGGRSPTSSSSSATGSSSYTATIKTYEAATVDTSKWKKPGPYTIADLWEGPINGWGTTYYVSARYTASHNPDIKNVVYASANGSLSTQLTQFDNIVQQHPDAIVVQPLDQAALVAPIGRAMSQGIPVVLCLDGIKGSNFATWVDIDLYQTGYAAADGLAHLINGKGNVALFNGIPGVAAEVVWRQAALDAFTKYPGIKVVGEVDENWSIATAKSKAASLISAHPDISGIFAGGSEGAVGAIEAYADAGVKMPAFGVTNVLNGFLRLAKQYNLKFWGYPDPPAGASACLDSAVHILKGQQVKKFVDLSAALPGTAGYNQEQLSQHYYPHLSDEFVPPPSAPVSAYQSAGLGAS